MFSLKEHAKKKNMDSLSFLKTLPFVFEITTTKTPDRSPWTQGVTVHTPDQQFQLAIYEMRGVPGQGTIARLIESDLPHWAQGKLLLSGHITPGISERLRAADVNYLDEAGNCYLSLGARYVAWLEGRKPTRVHAPKGLRASGYRVLGAFLDDPNLPAKPLRAIAASCGVSVTAVRSLRAQLLEEHAMTKTQTGYRLRRRVDLLDRWLVGYRDLIRPKLYIDRFNLPGRSEEALQLLLEKQLGGMWCWGGSAASYRLFHTGTTGETIIHLKTLTPSQTPRVPLRATEDGTVVVTALPHMGAIDSANAHPGFVSRLLILGELSVRSDPRSLATAADVREGLLFHWGLQREP